MAFTAGDGSSDGWESGSSHGGVWGLGQGLDHCITVSQTPASCWRAGGPRAGGAPAWSKGWEGTAHSLFALGACVPRLRPSALWGDLLFLASKAGGSLVGQSYVSRAPLHEGTWAAGSKFSLRKAILHAKFGPQLPAGACRQSLYCSERPRSGLGRPAGAQNALKWPFENTTRVSNHNKGANFMQNIGFAQS